MDAISIGHGLECLLKETLGSLCLVCVCGGKAFISFHLHSVGAQPKRATCEQKNPRAATQPNTHDGQLIETEEDVSTEEMVKSCVRKTSVERS